MFNDIKIGPVTFHMYGLMIAIGFAAALMMCLKRGKKRGLNEDIIYGIFFCAIFGGMIGCRLLYYIVEIPEILKDPSILWNFKNGYVVYGGIIGGALTSFIYCYVKKERFLPYFDLVMPSVSFAQGFGRLGCFFAGCCYGKETSLPIGIVFPEGSFAPAGVPLLPTQLFSSAGDFVIAFVLIRMTGKMRHTGDVGALYLMLYGIGRFCVEFLRTNEQGGFIGLTTAQLISIVFMIISIVLFIRNKRAADREDLMYI